MGAILLPSPFGRPSPCKAGFVCLLWTSATNGNLNFDKSVRQLGSLQGSLIRRQIESCNWRIKQKDVCRVETRHTSCQEREGLPEDSGVTTIGR